MKKYGIKTNCQLKFDTSKVNLECFIKKKSASILQNDKNDRKRKNSRGKPKSLARKTQDFQEEKFLSSIIKNAMEEQFEDSKQVTEMLHKMQVYGQEKHESPTNEDEILKNFEIFKEPIDRFTPEIGYFTLTNSDIKAKNEQKKQGFQNGEMQISLCKEAQWNNFSTQIESDVGTERSRKQQFVEQHPQILPNQYYVPVNAPVNYEQADKQFYVIQNAGLYMGLSKQQRQRKSTPIRGENEQFRIKLEKIENDGRTTLMIRHIPNKYTQQMLIDEINQNHKLKYNFFYLPVDSYNPCNVGYAFINFIDTKFIAKFCLEFNGKRWNKIQQLENMRIGLCPNSRIYGVNKSFSEFQCYEFTGQKIQTFYKFWGQLWQQQVISENLRREIL